MACQTLLPDPDCLTLDGIRGYDGAIIFDARTICVTATCPLCHHVADRVHSRYRRKLLDLPWQGNAVRVELTARKFFCDNRTCQRRVFAEPLPTVATRYSRKTARLADALRELAYLAGGEAAARIAQAFGLIVSPDALLRHLKQTAMPTVSTPRVLGIDDFAFRRGRRYGTVLVDLEKRRPVDLLPNREPETVATWLREHPGVEVISRDRGGCYIDGAIRGAPEAVQVADRWHLVKNLGDALERLLTRQHKALHHAQHAPPQSLLPLPDPKPAPPSPSQVADKSARQERRQARFDQMKGLLNDGHSQREVARRTGYSRNTIGKVAQCSTLHPPAARPRRLRALKPFVDHLHKRWQEGISNATRLHEEITAMGYSGSVNLVQRYVQSWRNKPGNCVNGRRPAPVVLSPRQASWLLTNPHHPRVTGEQRDYLSRLAQSCPTIAAAQQLALEFCRLVRERDASGFRGWLDRVAQSDVREMKAFARFGTGQESGGSGFVFGMEQRTGGRAGQPAEVPQKSNVRAGFVRVAQSASVATSQTGVKSK